MSRLSDNILKLQEINIKIKRLKAMNQRDGVSPQFKAENEKFIRGLKAEKHSLVNAIITLKQWELGYTE